MFGIDSSGFIIIMIVALIFIGPERLPEIMAKLGKFMAQMRGMTNDVKRSFQLEFERVDLEKRKAEAMKELFPEEEPAKAEAQASAESELAVETAEMADEPGPPATSAAENNAPAGDSALTPAPPTGAEPTAVQAEIQAEIQAEVQAPAEVAAQASAHADAHADVQPGKEGA